MKHRTLSTVAKHIFSLGILIYFAGCEMDAPPVIYVENISGTASPVITSIDPPLGAISGVSQIKIIGNNFSPIDSLNHVIIDTAVVKVDSASTTMLIVQAPKGVIGNNLKIKVTVPGAFAIAQFQYKILPVAEEYGSFNDLDDVVSITVDKSDNLYAQLRVDGNNVKFIKVSPSGNKTAYAKGPFGVPKISQIKMGPDGYLYCQRSASNQLYRVSPGGADSASLYLTLPIPRGAFLDFDSLGNMYVAGRTNTSIVVVLANSQTMRTIPGFVLYDIRGVRVFNNYLYMLAVVSGKKGIFRAPITTSLGDLGSIDTVCNLSNVAGFGSKEIVSFNIASNGDILVGGDHTDPIYQIKNGVATPLYPGLLGRPVNDIVWGSDKYIYVNRNTNVSTITLADGVPRRVLKVITELQGAPDFGN